MIVGDIEGVAVRKVGPGDEDMFAKVADDVFDEPVVPDRLRDYLADSTNWMIVAIREGQIVGQCAAVVHRHPDKVTELCIDEVGVTPELQRRGIARKMMNHLLDLARNAGIGECWVGTENDNAAARALYESFRSKPEQFVLYYLDLEDTGHVQS